MARTSKPVSARNHPVEKQVNTHKHTEDRLLIPSGSVMLNLACSNTWHGAFEAGRMSNLIGDSSSGKTYLALEMLAQCANDPKFDHYDLIYDDAEHALSMDVEELFGSKLANRLVGPDGKPVFDSDPSRTVEDFHFNMKKALAEGRCIYVLDSFDALTSEQDSAKLDEMMKARVLGKEVAGSYRMAKPKKASELLQDIVSTIEDTRSFLLIISQTRDNINPNSFEKKTRSGGRALKFYAQHEIWLAVMGKLKKVINGKTRVIGSELRAKVSKNKLTGSFREVEFDFRHGYGCDDITSCLEFLKQEGVVTGSGKNFQWREHIGSMPKLITAIEDNNLEKQLFKDSQQAWLEIEEQLKPTRKSKYGE